MSWTDQRVEKLKELWAEGMSASQIAKELGGVTRNAVIGKVHRLGLSSRNHGKSAESAEPEPAPAAPPTKAAAPEKPPEPEPAQPDVKPEEPAAKAEPAPEQETEQPAAPAPVYEPVRGEPLVNLAEIDKNAKKLSLLQLNERTCKWPIGDPSEGEFYFCGHPAAPGKPYCASHIAAAYQPMSSRRDRERNRTASRSQSA